jgi:hypothetical protein
MAPGHDSLARPITREIEEVFMLDRDHLADHRRGWIDYRVVHE